MKQQFKKNAQTPTADDCAAYYQAAVDGNVKGIDTFIEKYGVENVDIQFSVEGLNWARHSALSYCSMYGAPMESFEALKKYGANPNKRNFDTGNPDSQNWDSCAWALNTRNFTQLEFMVKQMGANTNLKYIGGDTLLMDAVDMAFKITDFSPEAAQKHAGREAFKMLLPRGDFSIRNDHNETLFGNIKRKDRTDLMGLYQQEIGRRNTPAANYAP